VKPIYFLSLIIPAILLAYWGASIVWTPLPLIADPLHLLALGLGLGAVSAAVGVPYWRLALYVNRLEEQIPQAIRTISDAAAAGLGVEDAFRLLAASGLRPMSDLARQIVGLVEARGLSPDEALMEASSRVPSQAFRRFASIISYALRSGARTQEVLDAASRSFAAVVQFEKEFSSQLRPYVALFYAFIAMAAAIADILLYLLAPQLSKLSITPQPSAVPLTVMPVNVAAARAVLAYLMALTSISGGVIVGKLAYNSPAAGLLHGGLAAAASVAALVAPGL
jgi:flagellar protein FlaJ